MEKSDRDATSDGTNESALREKWGAMSCFVHHAAWYLRHDGAGVGADAAEFWELDHPGTDGADE